MKDWGHYSTATISNSKTNLNERKEAALYYASIGWPVFPVRPGGKEPLVKGGYKAATTDTKKLEKWWERWPDANIGFPPGMAGLVVVDVDPRNGGDKTLERLIARCGNDFPNTVKSDTGGGGIHLFYRAEGPARGISKSTLGPGIDVIGTGGYVVLPPSVHPSGQVYRWGSCVPTQAAPPAPLPARLAERLEKVFGNQPEWPSEATGARGRGAGAHRNACALSGGRGGGAGTNTLVPAPQEKVERKPFKFALQSTTQHRQREQPGWRRYVVRGPSGEIGKREGRELLLESLRSQVAVEAACRLMGIPFCRVDDNRSASFHCILPGHDERRPSANLYRMYDGEWLYACWHWAGRENREYGKDMEDMEGRTGPAADAEREKVENVRRCYYLPLAEVYHAWKTGILRKLSRPELATWLLRLLVEIKYLPPARVNMPPLPEEAGLMIRRIYDGFRLLLECKWLYEEGAPTTFSWRFASEWCGVPQTSCGRAIQWLLSRGIIIPAGTHKNTMLFLPSNYSTPTLPSADADVPPVEEGAEAGGPSSSRSSVPLSLPLPSSPPEPESGLPEPPEEPIEGGWGDKGFSWLRDEFWLEEDILWPDSPELEPKPEGYILSALQTQNQNPEELWPRGRGSDSSDSQKQERGWEWGHEQEEEFVIPLPWWARQYIYSSLHPLRREGPW